MAKVRELGLAYNAHVPLDLELDAFATLLEAEERRQDTQSTSSDNFTEGGAVDIYYVYKLCDSQGN